MNNGATLLTTDASAVASSTWLEPVSVSVSMSVCARMSVSESAITFMDKPDAFVSSPNRILSSVVAVA